MWASRKTEGYMKKVNEKERRKNKNRAGKKKKD